MFQEPRDNHEGRVGPEVELLHDDVRPQHGDKDGDAGGGASVFASIRYGFIFRDL